MFGNFQTKGEVVPLFDSERPSQINLEKLRGMN